MFAACYFCMFFLERGHNGTFKPPRGLTAIMLLIEMYVYFSLMIPIQEIQTNSVLTTALPLEFVSGYLLK